MYRPNENDKRLNQDASTTAEVANRYAHLGDDREGDSRTRVSLMRGQPMSGQSRVGTAACGDSRPRLSVERSSTPLTSHTMAGQQASTSGLVSGYAFRHTA